MPKQRELPERKCKLLARFGFAVREEIQYEALQLTTQSIFLQTAARDAFQSEIQNVSVVREELADIGILVGRRESLHVQRSIGKIYEAESQGDGAWQNCRGGGSRRQRSDVTERAEGRQH